MEFLTNTHDPSDKNLRMYVSVQPHETLREAVARHTEWLKGKVIGEPQATEAYTVAQLKEMGLVGVYMPNNSVHPTVCQCGKDCIPMLGEDTCVRCDLPLAHSG